jgi:hypothetical protein
LLRPSLRVPRRGIGSMAAFPQSFQIVKESEKYQLELYFVKENFLKKVEIITYPKD